MKRFLAMLVAVLMALSLVTIPVTAEKDPEPEAVFTAGSATAEPGESFDLSIDVTGEYEAHTLNMQVNYDQDVLTIDSIDWGEVLNSVEGAMVIVDYTTIPGSVRIGMICPSDGATAQGQIVNIHFTVADDAEAGEYPVELVIVNFDYLPAGETIADPYETAVQNGVVTVPNDEPIPATDLDEALNVAGGTLHFEPVGSYTFEVEEDHAVSNNYNVHNSDASVEIQNFDFSAGTVLNFKYKISSEANWDKLQVLADGAVVFYDSGDKANEWIDASVTIPIGTTTVIVRYHKDGSGNSYDDKAWIDEFQCTDLVHVTGVEFAEDEVTMPLNRTYQLEWNVLPEDATIQTVSFHTSDSSIATVNASGLVTSIASGDVEIEVTTTDGGYTDICTVHVEASVDVAEVIVAPASITIPATGTFTERLTATILPENATNTDVTWSSSNESIVTFDSTGSIKGVNPGVATIYATADNGVFGTCEVTVVAVEDFPGIFDLDFISMNPLDYYNEGINIGYGYGTPIMLRRSSSSSTSLYSYATGFSYEATGNETVYFFTDWSDDEHTIRVDTYMTLYDSEGNILAYNDDDNAHNNSPYSGIEYEFTAPGTYYIVITPYNLTTSASAGPIRVGATDISPEETAGFFVDTYTAAVNEEIVVPVVLYNYAGDAHILNMQVNYNAAALEVASVEWGEFLNGAQGALVIVDHTSIPGSVRIGMACASDPAPAGDNPIAIVNIHFNVLEGAASVNPIELVVAEFANMAMGEDTATPIEFTITNGAITVEGAPDETPVPETPAPETPAPGGTATIILEVGDVWGDGSGYQMLLDPTHTFYGNQIPTEGPLTSSGNAPAGLYESFGYTIPVNADGNLNTSNIVINDSVSIQVPAGTYDWCIANPTPGDRIWIASAQGNVGGRADDYVFEAGYTYHFVVYLLGQNDATDVTITPNNPDETPTPIVTDEPVTEIPGETTGWYFESDPAADGWTWEDHDGDGNNWQWAYDAGLTVYEGLGVMNSQSYINYVGALTPDNWLITPAFVGGGELTFYMAGQDPDWAAEPIGVYVTTDGGATWSEELGYFVGTGEYVQHTVDLSAYAGQTINVAFRHYDVTDMFSVNIDQVEATTGGDTPVETPTPIVTDEPVTEIPGETTGWYFESDPAAEGWTWEDHDGDGNNWQWAYDAGLTVYEGLGVMNSQSYINYVGALTPDNWLITPAFVGGGELTFYMAGQDPAYASEPIGVYVSMDGGATWDDELAYFVATGDYVQQHVDLSDYAGVTIQVAFRHYDVTDQFSVNIDQVEVTTGGDTPVETPTPIVTDEPVTDEPVTDEPVTEIPGETIGWYFESDPAAEGWTWEDHDGDGNNWQWAYDAGLTVYEGLGVMNSQSFINFFGPLTPDNWLITPAFVGGGELTFYMAGQDPAYAAEPIGVYVSMDGGATWGDELAYFVATGDYVQQHVDLSDYAGVTIQVAFRHYDVTDQFSVNIDQVEVTTGGDTPVETPTPIVTDEPVTDEPVTEIPGETTGWYFESDPAAEGWTWEDHDGDGNNWAWMYDTGLNVYEGLGMMNSQSFINYVGALTPDNWLITPEFVGGGELTFYMAGQDPAYAAEVIGVYVSMDGGATWSDELAYFTATGDYVQQHVDLSDYAGQTIKVAFRHYDVTDMFSVNIDQVEVTTGGDTPVETPTPIVTEVPGETIGWFFETDPEAEGWTWEDHDGDGNNWAWMYDTGLNVYEGLGMMNSQSFINYVGALTPDNWLITPEFVGGGELTFYMAGQDPAYAAEPIGVYVSMDGGATWGDELAYFTATGDYVQQHVDLSDYAGVTIQVAFRHYDVTDMFSVNIDQVEVTTGGDTPVETPTPIVTDEPVTDEPVTDEPVTDEPVTDEPVTDEPVTDVPVTDEPVTDEPVTDEPVTDVPVTDEPVTDVPVTDEPVTDEPVTDEPVTDAPVTDEPNPPIPPTGTIALVGLGVAAVLAGAGIVLFRKKED